MNDQKKVYVFGHKNPDTDAICSAVAYCAFKKLSGDEREFVPGRLGDVNSETAYVLERFGHEAPPLIDNVRTQVSDLTIREGERVNAGLSIRKAWEILSSRHESTLAVVDDDDRLEGLITIGDIARSIMEAHDELILAKSRTPYSNIIETLEADVLAGDPENACASGKVVTAAANPDQLEDYIEPGDIVILSDRYESQLCALEMQAGCLIICIGSEVNDNILNLARDTGCLVLRTGYDTYTVSRLMNESIPIDYFMMKDGLMTFGIHDYIDDIRGTIAKVRHRAFPVLDDDGRLAGMMTRQSLLQLEPKQVVLVDHNEISQSADGISEAEIVEIVDHHKVGKVETGGPIMYRAQPVGCTSTILYMMFEEQGVDIPADIAGLMCSAIISDTLLYRSPTCTEADRQAAEALAKIAGVDTQEHAKAMFRAGSDFANKSEEDLLYQDFKKFRTGETGFGVGQITSMDGDELEEISGKMAAYMKNTLSGTGLDMLFLMMTDILNESTILLCAGPDAADKVSEYSGCPKKNEDSVYMEGVVSRKKQIVPLLMEALS